MSVVRSCITSWDTRSRSRPRGPPGQIRDETTITQRNPLHELLLPRGRGRRPGYRVIADVAAHRSTAVRGRSGESACCMPRTKRSASRSTARAPRPGLRWRRWTCCRPPIADLDPVRRLRAAHQVFVDSAITHERLPFGIDKIGVETRAGAGGRRARAGRRADPVLHAAALRQGPARRRAAAAARAARRPAVRALRDPAHRHRPHACCRTTTSTSPTGTTPATSASSTARSGWTSSSTTSSSSCRCSGPARTSWPSASRACRCWRRSRCWPRTATSPSRRA